MLTSEFDPSQSILENEHNTINLVRWFQQCELLNDYYKSSKIIILQRTNAGYEVITCAGDHLLHPGLVIELANPLIEQFLKAPWQGLQIKLSETQLSLPEQVGQLEYIISRPIRWPDSSDFGCLIVLSESDPLTAHASLAMLEPVQVLLQQDLALMCQNQRISSLSMRDRLTGMLNQYGFLMMAPRQLALGRRFGSHAGILFFELMNNSSYGEITEKDQQVLGRVIQDTIRTADIAARYTDKDFVVLVFLDSDRDLQHIIRRAEKSLQQQAAHLVLDANACFFSPDSSSKLAPMIQITRAGLKSQQTEPSVTSDSQMRV